MVMNEKDIFKISLIVGIIATLGTLYVCNSTPKYEYGVPQDYQIEQGVKINFYVGAIMWGVLTFYGLAACGLVFLDYLKFRRLKKHGGH